MGRRRRLSTKSRTKTERTKETKTLAGAMTKARTKAKTKETKVDIESKHHDQKVQTDGGRKAMMRVGVESEETVKNSRFGTSTRGRSMIEKSVVMTATGSILVEIVTGTALRGAMTRMTITLMMVGGQKYLIGISTDMTIRF